MPTVAARYSPVYYLPVGIVLTMYPDATGIVAARLVAALLAALLFAAALVIAIRLGSRPLAVAVVLTATPMATNLAGAINPNGLEIAAGVLTCSAVFGLVLRRDAAPVAAQGAAPGVAPGAAPGAAGVRRLLWAAGVGSVLLLTLRQLGPVLLGLILGSGLLLAPPGRIGAIARRRDARLILGGCWAVGIGFTLCWLLISHGAMPMPPAGPLRPVTLGAGLAYFATHRVPFFLKQTVGQFSYGETNPARYVVVLWYLLFAVLVLPSLTAPRRVRAVVVGLPLACVAMLGALDAHYLPQYGWFTQGRYAMPAALGAVLVAALAAGARGRPAVGRRGVAAVLTGTAVLLHVIALAEVMTRFQVGFGARLDPFSGSWLPRVGPLAPLLCLFGGGLLAAGIAVFVAGREAETDCGGTGEPSGTPTAGVVLSARTSAS